MEILWTIVIIGKTQNEYIEDILSASINIFALDFIPRKYIPEISGRLFLERLNTAFEEQRSGYDEGTTFYLII